MTDKVVHEDAEGKVFGTKKLLADETAFGLVDAMQPNARLNILIETAQNFRRNSPGRPVMATELAVNEVLKLRKEIGSLAQELKINRNRVERLQEARDDWIDLYNKVCDENWELSRPWYVKLLEWVRS